MSSSSDLNSIHNPISYTLPVKPIQSSLAPTDVRKQNQLNHNHNLQQAFQFSFQHQNQTHMNYNHPNYSSRSSSASSSSRNHPSPATSSGASSHASSLRTPPDLLLNPHSSSSASSSIAGTPYLGFKHGMTGNGFEKVQADPPSRFLEKSQIRLRLELLNGLPNESIPSEIPSPPTSPRRPTKTAVAGSSTQSSSSSRRQQPKDTESNSENKRSSEKISNLPDVKGKRKERDGERADISVKQEDPSSSLGRRRDSSGSNSPKREMDSNGGHRSMGSNKKQSAPVESTKRKRRASDSPSRDGKVSTAKNGRSSHSSSRDAKRFKEIPLPKEPSLKPRKWSKEIYVETAASYRRKGRDVKHAGDRRLREASTNPASADTQKHIAALEQTDALLHFVYGFWCEDQALQLNLAAKEKESRGSTGSLKTEPYACVITNWESLTGLLRYCIDSHERRKDAMMVGLCRLIEALVLRHTINHEQLLLNGKLSKVASEGPEASSAALSEISKSLSKLTSESDRSHKLLQSARAALAPSLIKAEAPRTWEVAIGEGMEMDPKKEAGNVDPGLVGVLPDGTGPSGGEGGRAVFAWPIEQGTPFSHVVTFGRRLLDEVAKRKKLDFRLQRVPAVREL